jgi:CO/xanthine dehydrogenase FAD-binding subunit
VKPAPFAYVAPRRRAEALEALSEYGADAKVLAGGQSLVPLLAMRLAQPKVLVDLNRIRDLAYIRVADGGVAIGAMTRQRAVETGRLVAGRVPLLQDAVRWIGHPQIRNRGTVGGSLAHADPSAELPAVAAALDARFVLASTRGERVLESHEFFTGYLTTALEPDEILTEVRFPAQPQGAGWAFLEVARRHGDFALAAVAVLLRADANGRCSWARLVFTGVGPGPLRVPEAEALLVGRDLGAAADDELREVVRGGLDPPSDIHATAEYRRHVAGGLAVRAVRLAVQRAGPSVRPRSGEPGQRSQHD